jgi:hypothetical protein
VRLLCSVCREQPCKTDLDVFRAIEKAEISPVDHPLVYRWRKSVLSYPEDERNRSELFQFAVGRLIGLAAINSFFCPA